MTAANNNPNEDAELAALVGAMLNETAAADERERLARLLTESAEARRAYLSYINVEAALRTRFALSAEQRDDLLDETAQSVQKPNAMPRVSRRALVWISGLLAVGLAASLYIAFFRLGDGGQPGPVQTATPNATGKEPIARVTKQSGAKWGAQSPAVSAELPAGAVDLLEGLAEITLNNGVRLVMDAPVRLELIDAKRAILRQGRIVARVPVAGHGFAIETSQAKVIDLGTEFGVGVQDSGTTEVQVFEGEVVAASKTANGKGKDQRLTAGSAVRYLNQQEPTDIPFQPENFVRMFPTDQDGGQPAGPLYNRSRFETVHVVPAATSPKIDGDLNDWDRSGAFYSACFPPYHETHYVEGMMMYDAERLYLAAHVGDPAPMQSLMDPSSDRKQFAWRGGSVIVRMVVDPKLGWPLDAVGPSDWQAGNKTLGRRPIDVDDRIVHMTLWYHRPTSRPRLQLSFGMDFHGEELEPQGWEGGFRKDPNGLGYTLEYSIPWSLLIKSGAAPPGAADSVATNWTVHWSDQDGRLSRGHLVEVVNPEIQPFRFLRARTWGKALFHADGKLQPDVAAPSAAPMR